MKGGKALAIPSGHYTPVAGMPHHVEWTCSTKANNCVLVNREGEAIRQRAANGRITAFHEQKGLSYVAGDAAAAYMGKIRRFDRYILFLLPCLFLLLDDLEAPQPALFQWMLHTLEKMELDTPFGRVISRRKGYTGFDTDGNHIDNAMLRATGNYAKLRTEDCVYDGHRAEVVRMDGPHQTARILNNIFRNGYQHDQWNKGRAMLSLRFHVQDTIIISGNTIFNTTTLFNHGATDTVQYFEVSKNTVYNHGAHGQTGTYINPGAFNGAFRFGAAQTLIIEDNIFYNVGWWGLQEGWADSFFVFQYIPTTSAATPIFRNNNIYLDPDLWAANPDTAEQVQNFDPDFEALLGDITASGNISEALTFTNAPGLDSTKRAIERYWADPGNSHLVILKLDDTIPTGDVDFSYVGALSAVGGTDGQPLGAPRWYESTTTDVEDESFAGLPASFELLGNYPNPFNPTTTIRFDLHKTAKVQVKVYNIQGHLVMETPEETLTAGSGQEYRIDASNWASAVYFYKVTAKTTTVTFSSYGRMLLLK